MEGQAQQIDMSREFTCYLCNGYALTVGSIVVTVVGIKLVNAVGYVSVGYSHNGTQFSFIT